MNSNIGGIISAITPSQSILNLQKMMQGPKGVVEPRKDAGATLDASRVVLFSELLEKVRDCRDRWWVMESVEEFPSRNARDLSTASVTASLLAFCGVEGHPSLVEDD